MRKLPVIICLMILSIPVAAQETRKQRVFEFHYGASISAPPTAKDVRVWFPIAQNNEHQRVQVVGESSPTTLERHRDAKYRNEIAYFQTKGSETPIKFGMDYEVTRTEADSWDKPASTTAAANDVFLEANRLVPIEGRPVKLLTDRKISANKLVAAEQLYEIVEQHMKYDKSVPGYGNGDSIWACDSKTGNCTDFHSLFISLARNQSIPARFEIGFPIPSDRPNGKVGGYHCWAWFFVEGKGWFPVDISEADKHPEMKKYYFGRLTPDRIAFSTGRDIRLVPESTGGPRNFFVYPYVEVDGEPLAKEKIKLDFSFRESTDDRLKKRK